MSDTQNGVVGVLHWDACTTCKHRTHRCGEEPEPRFVDMGNGFVGCANYVDAGATEQKGGAGWVME